MLDLFGIQRARFSNRAPVPDRGGQSVPPRAKAVPQRSPRELTPPEGEHPGWPEATPAVWLPCGWRVQLRPLMSSDGAQWRAQRIADEAILRPVEPTLPQGWRAGHSRAAWWAQMFELREAAKAGTALPLAVEVNGKFCGQVTMGNIQRGVVSECWIGYWVFSRYSGRGVATAACALGTDHAVSRVGMHRVTATYLPANPASGKVLRNNGFCEEGFLRRNLHIDGRWQDHYLVAQLAGQYPEGCVERLRAVGRLR